MAYRDNQWRLWMAMLVLLPCIGCDQATKVLATHALADGAKLSFAAGTVHLNYALNSGGFLSVGSALPPALRSGLFIGFNLCTIVGLGIFLMRKKEVHWLLYFSAILVLAGGVGNLIDRVFNHGMVIDFMVVGIAGLQTGVFNVADVAIMAGGIGIVIWSFVAQAALKTSEPTAD